MPVSNWWLVDDAVMRIISGPMLWDGGNDWSPPAGQRAVNADPTAQGYTWPAATPSGTPDTMASLTSRVAALETRLYAEARGSAQVPAIANVLGGTVTPRVTLKTPVRTAAGAPTTSYVPQAVLIPGVLLGALKVTATTVVSPTAVDVTIQSTGLVTLGQATVLVFADAS